MINIASVKTSVRENWKYLLAIAIAVLINDRFQKLDAKNLCSNEATAYSECGR